MSGQIREDMCVGGVGNKYSEAGAILEAERRTVILEQNDWQMW